MKQRKYFEPFALVGRKSAPDKYHPIMPEVLFEDMEYARVHGAAILHNTALDYSYVYGNCEAIKLADNNPRFFSLAATPTTTTFETGNPNYLKELLEKGVRGFVVAPQLRCSINPKNLREVCETLIEYDRPLIIPMGPFAEEKLAQIDILATAYPKLKIFLHGLNWSNGRTVWDMLERFENIYFDISGFQLNDILVKTKQHLGIHRVLYSSSWPIKSMGAIKALVEYSDITEEEKDMVACGNACRLFGISLDEFELYDDDKCQLDSLAIEADAGIPISVPIIDAHTHMIPVEDMTSNNSILIGADCDSLVKKMERVGIDAIITAPMSGITYDGMKGNEESIYAAKKYHGKFYGYATCNVNYQEDIDAIVDYHEKYPDILVGLKPYPPFHTVPLYDEAYDKWFAYADKHRLPILIHADMHEFISQAERTIQKYPNAIFILAHAGAAYDIALHDIELAKKYDNVVLEITYTATGRSMIEFLVEQVGADRVLYGSDQPVRDPAPQVAWVCYAKISVEDKKKILAGNIKRILDNRI